MHAQKLLLVSAVTLALAACGQKEAAPTQAATAEPGEVVVKIGHAAPLSGPVAHMGKDADNGVAIALDEANAEGLVIGGQKVKFELVSADDAGDPKTATQVAQRFVDDKIVGLVGHLTSGPTITASKIYAEAGIPQITPSATSPQVTSQGYKNVFRMIADDVQQGQAMAEFVVNKQGIKKIAVVDDRTAYGQGVADEFEKAAKAAGAEIVKREFTNDKATDFTAILTAIKATNPDAIYYGGMDAQAGPMARQMQKLGIKAKLFGSDGLYTPVFLQLSGDAGEGQYSSQPGAPRDKLPGYTSFEEKLKAKTGAGVVLYSTYAYDAARVLVDAMKRADSVDPAKYLPAVQQSKFNGATGMVEFDEAGNRKNGAVTIYQVRNGQWEIADVVGGGQ